MKRPKAKTFEVDAAKFNASALIAITAVMVRWLPDGNIHRKSWVAKSPSDDGIKPPSLRVNLHTGSWTDFSTRKSDHDLVSLGKYIVHAAEANGRLIDLEAMFAPFTPEELAAAPRIPEDEMRIPIVPVPADAPPMTYRHPEHGAYSQLWAYYDKNGGLVGYILRFNYHLADGTSRKEFYPITFCDTDTGRRWEAQSFPIPRPLYRLPAISKFPNATVLVCQGEKAADAAATLFPDMIATTAAGDFLSLKNADWTALAGRKVIISANSGAGGDEFASEVGQLAYQGGAADVWILHPKKLGGWVWREGKKMPRPYLPAGWDLADAQAEHWTAALAATAAQEPGFLDPAPKPLVLEQHGRSPFRMGPAGVERRIEIKDRGVVVGYSWKLVCGPLELIAETRDGDELNWGKLFQLTNPDGKVTEWHVPNSLLAGDGTEYREDLLNRGLKIESKKADRDFLQEYLSTVSTQIRARRVDRVGWHGEVYVTNNGHIGASASGERIVFAGSTQSKVGQQAGSRADWQENVAACAVGNSKLVFAISAAFAAPLLLHTRSESGGFHFVGPSSVGKTTALLVAGSVWGGGGTGGYLRSWRATANGLEGVAAAHCDGLLCLDEMGQANSREAGASAYMLANGVGKTRANRTGEARPAAEWRALILSTGEVGLADKVGEDSRSNPVAAGQQIRMIDLQADAERNLGMFEDIYDHATAADFARHLKKSAENHYGHAGPELVAKIAQDIPTAVGEVERLIEEFAERHRPSSKIDGQVERVIRKFGLIAAAGELAINYDVVPWSEGAAMSAVGRCFQGWIDARGTTGPLEDDEAVKHVRAYIQRYGSTRFFNSESKEEARGVLDIPVSNRVGFIKGGESVREYCFFCESWENDVCKGRDHKAVASALLERQFLVTGKSRKLNKTVRMSTEIVRAYVVKEEILFESTEQPAEPPQVPGIITVTRHPNADLLEKLKNMN